MAMENWIAAFSAGKLTILDQVAEGDEMVIRLQSSGTPRGEYMGALVLVLYLARIQDSRSRSQ